MRRRSYFSAQNLDKLTVKKNMLNEGLKKNTRHTFIQENSKLSYNVGKTNLLKDNFLRLHVHVYTVCFKYMHFTRRSFLM